MEEEYQPGDRRPITSRDNKLIQRIASWMAGNNISANGISVSSAFFGLGAGTVLYLTTTSSGTTLTWMWVLSAVFIQLRLLANLLDGMVAIEGGQASPVGELYNEAPDRISDSIIFIGAGYTLGSDPILGYATALIAMFVAYARALGATAGAGQSFLGPMAKPHRMFLLTLSCFYCAFTPLSWQPVDERWGLSITGGVLVIIIGGCFITAIRRFASIGTILRNAK